MSRRNPNESARARQRAKDDADLPLVSLIGRPNVGKSSLFNRLVGGRPAIVEDVPGVTRDRRYGVCSWVGSAFRVCDTGGLDPSAEGILGAMRVQTLRAVEEATVLVFVVDATHGKTAVDADVARVLRRTGKPVFVAANKVDTGARESMLGELYGLGFERVFPVSASHGRGVSDLCDALADLLGEAAARPTPAVTTDVESDAPGEADQRADEDADDEDADDAPLRLRDQELIRAPIRLAFVGKPNAGKSSLLNRLLGEDRVLVHAEPGTTRDPIDTPFRFGDREFVLVDTAGIRRRKVQRTLTEAVSAKMARDQIERADVVALVMDAQLGATEEDARLASLVEESGRALVLVLNKNDLVPRADAAARSTATRETLAFVNYAPLVITSAVTGRGVRDIVDAAINVHAQWTRRVPTSELNRHFEEMTTRRPPPAGPSGRHIRLYYITQAEIGPPRFFVSSNLPAAVGYPYRRFIANQLRKIYGFEGAPIKLAVRGRGGRKRSLREGVQDAGRAADDSGENPPDLIDVPADGQPQDEHPRILALRKRPASPQGKPRAKAGAQTKPRPVAPRRAPAKARTRPPIKKSTKRAGRR